MGKNTPHFHQGARSGFTSGRIGASIFRYVKPKGKRERQCRHCSNSNRVALDIRWLTGYTPSVNAPGHFPGHLAEDLAEAKGVQDGTYAEQLIGEFDDMVAELKEIISEARARSDHKLAFEAMRTRGDVLIAKGRALGLGSATAASKKQGVPVDPGRVERKDVAKLVESFRRTTTDDEQDEARMSTGDTVETGDAG